MQRSTSARLLGLVVAGGMLMAACGGDDSSSSSSAASTAAPSSSAAATTAASSATTAAGGKVDLDFNKDGKVVVGVATPGPRDDGAYYQALVTGVQKFAKDNGFADPIIVDKIAKADAATALDNLARQKPDIIAVGASEIADPLKDMVTKYKDIFWYCNCGAGYPADPNLAQSQDDSSEISYTAGYATGLLMKAKGTKKAAFLGCCDLNFEQEAFKAFQLGLKAVDSTFEWQYVATGDFNDTAKATEAFNNVVSQGVGAVYPFLGGSHEAVVKLANDKGVIVMSAGSSKACARTDLKYDIAVRFDAGDYLDTLFKELLNGTFKRGTVRVFHVGVDPQPGAEICKPTADQTTAMKDVYGQIAAGKFNDQFLAIKKEVYKF